MLVLWITAVFQLAAGQNLLLREPQNQEVYSCRNATFHCDTRSYDAYWVINRVRYPYPSNYNGVAQYVSVIHHNDVYYNNTLTVVTSELERSNSQNITIACYYFYDNNTRETTRTAQLVTRFSCFLNCSGEEGMPRNDLVLTDAHLYFSSPNRTMIKVLFELPPSCANLAVHYSVIVRDDTTRMVLSKGPVAYTGSSVVTDELINSTGVELNHVYYVQVEAYEWVDSEADKILSNVLKIGIYLNTEDICDDARDNNNSISKTTISSEYAPVTDSWATEQWTVTVSVLGALIGIVLFFITVLLGVLIRSRQRKSHRYLHEGGVSASRVMVPNPIYDGPMYECIPQSLRKVSHSHSDETGSTTASSTCTPSTDMSADSPRALLYNKYVLSPHRSSSNKTETEENYANLVVLSAPPTTSTPNVAPPTTAPPTIATSATYAQPKTSSERNKFKLTLHLDKHDSFEPFPRPRTTSMVTGNRVRLERGRCGTEPSANMKPQKECEVGDGNYIAMNALMTRRGTVSGAMVREAAMPKTESASTEEKM